MLAGRMPRMAMPRRRSIAGSRSVGGASLAGSGSAVIASVVAVLSAVSIAEFQPSDMFTGSESESTSLVGFASTIPDPAQEKTTGAAGNSRRPGGSWFSRPLSLHAAKLDDVRNRRRLAVGAGEPFDLDQVATARRHRQLVRPEHQAVRHAEARLADLRIVQLKRLAGLGE